MNCIQRLNAYVRDLNISKLEWELGIGKPDHECGYYRVSLTPTGSGVSINIGHGIGGYIFAHVRPPTGIESLRGISFENKVSTTIKRAQEKCDKLNADREFITGIVEKVA